MTELALPAGSLQAALVAFNEGADAVYLGMRRFSARKEATNFNFEELSKLKQVANEQQKKIYVTVNTLITDEQLADVIKLLRQIAFIGCDGVIVQDLGVAHLIKTQFPSLPLHGSTQLAVHTIEGVRQMQDMGFERVVLSRELTLEEIQVIREACPDIELKIFIHGALCYGFSGLCTASKQLCGRSANCGACAQICRSWFSLEQDTETSEALSPVPEGKNTGWYFSMSDLKGGEAAKKLEEMGIESLKVEGRMKGPAYTLAASRYYRAVLDGKASEEEKQALDQSLSVVFARRQTGGWLTGYGRKRQSFEPRNKPTLGSTSYPGHRGIPAAQVLVVKSDYAVVTTKCDLAIRDGIMFFTKGINQPIDTVKFSLSGIYNNQGASMTYAYKGETVEIELPRSGPIPHSGETLYLISAHDQNPALLNENLPTSKFPLDMTVIIEKNEISIQTNFMDSPIIQHYPMDISVANKSQDLTHHLQTIFAQSDTSFCTLGTITYTNNTELKDEEVFLPLSILKSIRRDWYGILDKKLANWLEREVDFSERTTLIESIQLPGREKLCTKGGLPYLDIPQLASYLESGKKPEGLLFFEDGKFFLPLSPVMFEEEKYYACLDSIIKILDSENDLGKTYVGLNNIAQIRWAKKNPQVHCFFDAYLYLANSEAAIMATELLPNLAGGYLWGETDTYEPSRWPFVPSKVGDVYTPPLFISRSCFRRDSLMLKCDQCPHKGSWYVKQQNHRYHVMVNDCITTVTKA
ncbi:U32 family peptidase [uncultured Sphaerochaeta sp.]|uniref:peptidase U32 family protein n=1 Tax=uncultured Sphaerochaeta sp. TaxID=886478 RepID=UPI002A0A2772|nr:U32 family peptidase [uncultured Sphaerochaeta sp.]